MNTDQARSYGRIVIARIDPVTFIALVMTCLLLGGWCVWEVSSGRWPSAPIGWLGVVYCMDGTQREVGLMTLLYQESAETILSNFEAAGFDVSRTIDRG